MDSNRLFNHYNIMITLFTPKMYSYWLSGNLFNIKFQDFELDVS